jgi:hypothetical protein
MATYKVTATSRFGAAASVLFTVVGSAVAVGAENLVAPAYPSDTRDKPLRVNVLVCGQLDAGKPTTGEVLYNDGPGAFADAASPAFEKCTFGAGRSRATVWYVFRLMQDTEVLDVSRNRLREFDAAPELIEYVAPTFPPGAPSLTTDVSLDLFIGPDGSVWYAEQAGDGADPLYVERALAAARQFKFEPAVLDGETTATWYPFVIEFK